MSPLKPAKQQNLSSGFPTKLDSNQSPQLQRLARRMRYDIFKKQITKGLRERSGSVVECLTRDGGAVGSSLTGVTLLCP